MSVISHGTHKKLHNFSCEGFCCHVPSCHTMVWKPQWTELLACVSEAVTAFCSGTESMCAVEELFWFVSFSLMCRHKCNLQTCD